MTVTPTIENVQPTVGASADTWGSIVNERLQETYVDINALATQSNSNETGINNLTSLAVYKSGSTSTGDQVLADVNATSIYSAGYRGTPVVNTDINRTFLGIDSGKMIRLFGAVARVWTIPANSFPIGTVIVLRNYASANLTISRGVGVTMAAEGGNVNADYTIASFGKAAIIQEDANFWVIGGTGVS